MNKYKILTLSLVIFGLNVNLAQITELKLIPNDPQNVVSFGSSVAIDENILVVGGPESDILGTNSGAVVVFEKLNGNWVEDTLLL
ncbi:MAG: FG-GAP repeat protein, partial [Ignavibacteriaceae bacterium]